VAWSLPGFPNISYFPRTTDQVREATRTLQDHARRDADQARLAIREETMGFMEVLKTTIEILRTGCAVLEEHDTIRLEGTGESRYIL